MLEKTKAANATTFTASQNLPMMNQQTNIQNNYKAKVVVETRRNGKVIKLFRCFGCDNYYGAKLMSSFLMICTNCFSSERFENERSRQRFIEKTLKKIGTFLRRRI